MTGLKKLLCVLTASAAVLTTAICAAASDLTDIKGHWAEPYIEQGVKADFVHGYPDGTFKPNSPVTRAEFCTMLNAALGISRTSRIDFADVDQSDWFYDQVGKALWAGYVSGYEDNTFRASNNITRQEAAVILSRLITPVIEEKKLSDFNDEKSVADWAADAFTAAYSKGYFNGDNAGNLRPTGNLTRAEATKVICAVVKGENVVSGEYTVEVKNATLSRILFTDNVVYDGKDGGTLDMEGCRVLGSVSVSSEKAAVTVDDSIIDELDILSDGIVVSSKGKTVITDTALQHGAVLKGNYKNLFLDGENMLGSTTEIDGTVENASVFADAILNAKHIDKLVVTGKSFLLIQKGGIGAMEVGGSAAGSTINLAEDVTVDDLTVDAACDFKGKGAIKSAKNNAAGVTYETKPGKQSGNSSGDPKDERDDDPSGTGSEGSVEASSIVPENGETGVYTSSDVTITYPVQMYPTNGSTSFTESYLESCFELRKSSASGTKVAVAVTPSSTGKKFTLTPEKNLENSTKYYVIIRSGYLKTADGAENIKQTVSFTTKAISSVDTDERETERTAGEISFTPNSKSTNVSTEPTIKVTFPAAVYDLDKSTPSSRYLSTEAIELHEKSVSGTTVAITVSLNSTRKVATVEPDQPLKPNTKYYIVVSSGALKYSDGTSITKDYDYFMTADELSYTVTPASGSTAVSFDSEIKFVFNTEIYRTSGSNLTSSYLSDSFQLRKSSSSGTEIDFTARIDADKKTVHVIPSELETGIKYYVILPAGKIANESGTSNEKISVYFTTAASMAPSFTPTNGAEDVSTTPDIMIRFTEPVYNKEGKLITAEDVASGITLRKTSSSGAIVPFDVEVSKDHTTISVIPTAALKTNTKYYVAFAKTTVYNEAKKANTAGSATFTVGSNQLPDFLPYDEETDVPVDTVIEITFEQKMNTAAGDSLTTSYLKNNVITLYSDGDDATAVNFSVSLSSDGKTITVKPSTKLEGNTTYFVSIRKSTLATVGGDLNDRYVSSFTTEEKAAGTMTYDPENKETGVSLDKIIEVTFDSQVCRIGGAAATDSYLEANVFELRKGSSTGSKVDFTASIDKNNKTVYITPAAPLAPNATYYVKVLANKLEYADGGLVSAKSMYFKTGDGKPVINSIGVLENGASFATVYVVASEGGNAYFVFDDGSKKLESGAVAVVPGERAVYTKEGLDSSKKYTVSATVVSTSGVESAAKSIEVRTTEPFALEQGDVTDTTAAISVEPFCNGTITLKYTPKGGSAVNKVSGLALDANKPREFELTGLEPSTQYQVEAIFMTESGTNFTKTLTVVTEKAKVEVLEVKSISLNTSNGEKYNVTVKDGAASATVEKCEWFTVTGTTDAENAVFMIGETEFVPGKASGQITVAAGESKTVTLVLKSTKTEQTVEVTLTVDVNE